MLKTPLSLTTQLRGQAFAIWCPNDPSSVAKKNCQEGRSSVAKNCQNATSPVAPIGIQKRCFFPPSPKTSKECQYSTYTLFPLFILIPAFGV